MYSTMNRVLTKLALMAALASLAWYGLGCGNDDAQSEGNRGGGDDMPRAKSRTRTPRS